MKPVLRLVVFFFCSLAALPLPAADSFTIDFQKWGYVPYTSSLVMIKNRDDLKALEHDPEYFSYFEKNVGWILRRPDENGEVDVLDAAGDIDRRIAVALATLILGSEP